MTAGAGGHSFGAMSLTTSAAVPRPAARARTARSGRLALLFAVLLVTSVTAAGLSLLSLLKPIGAGGDTLPGYAALAPVREYAWALFTFAGVQMVVGVCAAALAAWILVPARGARWATLGGSLVWLGAGLYAVGIGGWAAVYYFGTDGAALGTATATRLIDRYNADAAHMLAVPVGGAALVMLGTLALAVALWRARSVPRWVPVVGALSAVATLVLPPDGPAGLIAECASSATTIALGWYAWTLSARPRA
jgi:hypothetical protein